MGATWASWRTTVAVIITMLQIKALIGVKTTAVGGVEGQRFDFRCEYPHGLKNNAKYLCHVDDNESHSHLIRTDKHDQWVREGRFSLFDNTSEAFFTVRLDELREGDGGTYWCGVDISYSPDHISVIQLNVSRVSVIPSVPMDPATEKLHTQLFLTAVMCVAAMLFVCLFTFCLLLAVKHRPPREQRNREITTSDYETMMPGVTTEPELCPCPCSDPGCTGLPAPPPPPADICPHFTSTNRESTVSLGLGDYVDVDVSGHICPYQHLDLSRLEDHVYHSLNGNSGPKDGCGKQQIHS